MNPRSAPEYYRWVLQNLYRYIRLLTTVVGKKRLHSREVVVIRKTLSTWVYLYIYIDQKRMIYLLWEISLDDRYLFSKEVQQVEALPYSMLWYTTNFLGVGRIPIDIIAVPVSQLGGE